ncbi:unnamed protein product, partial [Mesorhabditis spiculigera]
MRSAVCCVLFAGLAAVAMGTEIKCTVRTDCPDGYLCVNNVCIANPNGGTRLKRQWTCKVHGDCGERERCSGGRCVSMIDHPFPDQPHWVCASDSDCNPGDFCAGGQCQALDYDDKLNKESREGRKKRQGGPI